VSAFIPILIAELEQGQKPSSRTYQLDLERGRILASGSCDGLEAVNQYIRKALLTPRFRCLIYDSQYGSEIKQTIITNDVTREYIETEMPRLVKDAIHVDSRILDVYDFNFAYSGDTAHIRFKANTIMGETVIEEVV
jgi:hypothetical protein